jgi:alcohol dehydrogenase (cytochrome c)/quinohemoprotein ethanol dehydrogenase
MRNNKIAWQNKWKGVMCYSGVLSTDGGLVFIGRQNNLEAYNARNGNLVWRSPTLQGGANAAPMTFSVNGQQHIAIYAGGNGLVSFVAPKAKVDPGVSLYVFKLPG